MHRVHRGQGHAMHRVLRGQDHAMHRVCRGQECAMHRACAGVKRTERALVGSMPCTEHAGVRSVQCTVCRGQECEEPTAQGSGALTHRVLRVMSAEPIQIFVGLVQTTLPLPFSIYVVICREKIFVTLKYS